MSGKNLAQTSSESIQLKVSPLVNMQNAIKGVWKIQCDMLSVLQLQLAQMTVKALQSVFVSLS